MNIQSFYDPDRLYQIRYNPDDTVHFYNAGEEDMYKNYTGQHAPKINPKEHLQDTNVKMLFTIQIIYNLEQNPLEQIEKVDLLVLGCSHIFGVGLPKNMYGINN